MSLRINRLRAMLLGSAISTATLGLGPTQAQTAPPSTPAAPATSSAADGAIAASHNDGVHLNEVIVTGTSAAKQVFKAPYAVTVLSAQQIADKAPTSVADALKGTPGLWVESTAGEAGSENIYARGLPGGSYEYFSLEEDGLPVFETQYETYANADIFERVDLGVERAEIVRGGTAPIYVNNAPGGVANFITNHGTKTEQGAFKVTTGSDGLARADLTASGPVAPNLLLSVSGFGRVDNGLRNPGFNGGDQGGQFKIGATYLLPRGKIWGDIKYLNDRGVFYADIPLTNPVTGQSLNSVINQNYGALQSASVENQALHVLTPGGGAATISRNLQNGIHPTTITATAGIDYDLGENATFTDTARFIDGKEGVDYFLNGQYVTGGADGFSAQAYANNLVAKVPGAVSARYVVAGTNTPVSPTDDLALANNYVSARTTLSDFINDARLNEKLNDPVFGVHDLSAGIYFSHYTFSQQRLIDTFLTTINNHATVLDVQALGAGGQVLGDVTDDGVTSFGNGASGRVEGNAVSYYGGDTWHVTKDWQIDVGVRQEIEQEHGFQGVTTTQALTLPGVIVPINVSGATSFTPKSETLRGSAWTVGTQYQVAAPANVFVRYTDSYQFPRFQNIYAGASYNGKPLPVSQIYQAEGGLKLNWPGLSIFAVGFYSHFNPLITSILVQNASNNLVNQTIIADTTDYGGELEADWAPVRAFSIHADVTLQHSNVTNVQDIVNNAPAAGISTAGADGKQEPRIPNALAYIEPTYYFDLGAVKGRVFTTVSYVGVRYQDYNNLSRIPAYSTADLGATADYRNITFGVHVLNLTNSTGLTEGNSRASAVALTPSTPVADVTVGRPIFGRTFTLDATYRW